MKRLYKLALVALLTTTGCAVKVADPEDLDEDAEWIDAYDEAQVTESEQLRLVDARGWRWLERSPGEEEPDPSHPGQAQLGVMAESANNNSGDQGNNPDPTPWRLGNPDPTPWQPGQRDDRADPDPDPWSP